MGLARFGQKEERISKAVTQLAYIMAAEIQHGEMQSIAYQRDQLKTTHMYKKS